MLRQEGWKKEKRSRVTPTGGPMASCPTPSRRESSVSSKQYHCAKSLQGEAPCGGAVYGKVDEMSPAPSPTNPPPPPTPGLCNQR